MHPRMHSGTHSTHTSARARRGPHKLACAHCSRKQACGHHARMRTQEPMRVGTEVHHCADTADRGNQLKGWLLLSSLVSCRYLAHGARRWEGQSCKTGVDEVGISRAGEREPEHSHFEWLHHPTTARNSSMPLGLHKAGILQVVKKMLAPVLLSCVCAHVPIGTSWLPGRHLFLFLFCDLPFSSPHFKVL